MLPPKFQNQKPQTSGWQTTWIPFGNSKTVVESSSGRVWEHDQDSWCSLKIGERLGSGGAGDVFLAHCTSTQVGSDNRPFAIKICRDESADGIDRFKREFRALRSLKHLPVAHSGRLACDNGLWGFTLRYCDGKSPLEFARANLPMGVLPDLHLVTRLGRQMAAGLARMHDSGITHGDIKPGNMIVEASGRLWFLDFGLSCRESLSDQVVHPKGGAGTFQFLAPEVILRGQYGMAADIFALGRTLYLILAGRLPSADYFRNIEEYSRGAEIGVDAPYFQRIREQLPPGTPLRLVELLQAMLHPLPQCRPTGLDVAYRLGFDKPLVPDDESMRIDPWVDPIRLGARRAGKGHVAVTRSTIDASMVNSAIKQAVSGLFRELPWFMVPEVDCRREQLPLRAFDATLSMLRFWGEQLPEPLRRGLPLKNNPALDLISGDFSAIHHPQLVDRALDLLQASTRNRLLVVPIRNLHYADPLSRQLYVRLLKSPVRQRLLLLISRDV